LLIELELTGIFYDIFVKNIGGFHWVLDVAVNPFCLLGIVSGWNDDLHDREKQCLYGFLHIDPL
jgi:hypothetical protein